MNKNEAINSSKNNHNGENSGKIEEHMVLVEQVVQEFKNSGESEEQLKQVAYIGLLNAINLYKNQKGVTFEEYAKHLIEGEIRHFIREKHKKVKVPAWLDMMNKFIDHIIIAYHRQFKKYPDLKELSKMLNLSPEGLNETLKAREAAHKVSIDEKRRERDIKEGPDTAKIKKAIKRRGHEK